MDNFPIIGVGDRAVVAGRTGSGKSTLGCWLLNRSKGHWVILNPKGTKAYDRMPGVKTLHGIDYKKIEKSIAENPYTNIVPTVAQNTPENLDNIILWLHGAYENIGVCADELYTLHTNGRPGAGLMALLTRGRELKQSFLGLTQRPAWVSKFIFSEADYIAEMSLNLIEDRKRVFEITGQPAMLEKLPARHWLWYDAEGDSLRKFNPVPVSK